MTQVRINAVAFAELISALAVGGHTLQELSDETGLALKTIYAYTKALRRAQQIHIESWAKDKNGRKILRVYKLGPGRDAQKHRVSPSVSCKRWREKKRQQANLMALTAPILEAA